LAPESYLYMTTRGRKSGQPREIEIWFTERAGRFYVIAEHSTSNWVQNVRAESRVQVRVGVRQFAAQARILPPETDPELVRTIQNLSREKYGWGDGLVVELIPQEA
jgi:deazaflavin-dependent oxidoreductase (nitroreductase family)